MREIANGTTNTQLRTIVLLETPPIRIETVAVDQHADRIIAFVQEQQVGFRSRVRDGVEAMISAVRNFVNRDTDRVLMQGEISNAYGSINRLAVLKNPIQRRDG